MAPIRRTKRYQTSRKKIKFNEGDNTRRFYVPTDPPNVWYDDISIISSSRLYNKYNETDTVSHNTSNTTAAAYITLLLAGVTLGSAGILYYTWKRTQSNK